MAIPLKESFIYHHAKEALENEPDWTVRMYGVYNSLSDEIIAELERLLPQFVEKRKVG